MLLDEKKCGVHWRWQRRQKYGDQFSDQFSGDMVACLVDHVSWYRGERIW